MNDLNLRRKIRVAVITLGCKVNKYESDSMKEKLVKAGFISVAPEDVADFYIVNTCSVTNMAQKKSRQMLRRVKKRNPQAVVIAAGCYVNAEHEHILKEQFVDIVVGNNCKKDIVEVISDYMDCHGRTDYYEVINEIHEYEEMGSLGAAQLDHQRAYVKIQDGCNQFCSYCIIPYTRGRVRSRNPEHILTEIENLAKEGVKEFVLTGIHISSYGMDFRKNEDSKEDYINALDTEETSDNNITDLGSLIEAIAKLPDVKRIRLGSLEPRIITWDFLKKINSDKLCPHFHLSLQSACNDTLKRMNRHYTIEEFEEKCRMIRECFYKPALTTDVIVGFPGETEEEFSVTVSNLKKINFYQIHIFKYSVRAGTVAEKLPGQVPEDVKNKRSDVLFRLTALQKEEFERSLEGFEDEVLIEEAAGEVPADSGGGNKRIYYVGHTKRYIKVNIASEENLVNKIVRYK